MTNGHVAIHLLLAFAVICNGLAILILLALRIWGS